MKYELICGCGDHIELELISEWVKGYRGYCLGCDKSFLFIEIVNPEDTLVKLFSLPVIGPNQPRTN